MSDSEQERPGVSLNKRTPTTPDFLSINIQSRTVPGTRLQKC